MRKIYVLFAAILAVATSCKKEFNLELNGTNKNFLVVDGMITDQNEPQVLRLSRTVSYLKPEDPQKVSGAVVTVESEGVVTTFSQTTPGVYVAPMGFYGKVGKTYNLTINVDGKEYKASYTMRKPLILDAVSTKTSQFDKDKFDVRAAFTENSEKGDSYLLKYALNGALCDTVENWSRFNDNAANGETFTDINIFGSIDCKVNDNLTVYSYSISKEYYEFVQAAEMSLSEPLPFFPPPGASIAGNISNGGLGFFQAAAVRKISTVVKK